MREMGSLRESMTGETTMREVVEKELGEGVVAVAALSQGTPQRHRRPHQGRDRFLEPRRSDRRPDGGGDGGTLQIPGASIPVFDRSLGNPRERELFMALGA
jgi:hypothetical protein